MTDVVDGTLRVRVSHVQCGQRIEPCCQYYDTTPERWIGEWSGHDTTGRPCWCVPRTERYANGNVVIHNERDE